MNPGDRWSTSPLAADKENLIDYRWFTGAAVVLFVFSVIGGMVFHRFMGLWLSVLSLFCAIPVLLAFLRWNSEPTAKRQYGVLLVLMMIYSAFAGCGSEMLILEYYAWRGECPTWLWAKFLCERA